MNDPKLKQLPIDDLIRLLTSGTSAEQFDVVETLGFRPDPRTIPPLVHVLQVHPDAKLRGFAAQLLSIRAYWTRSSDLPSSEHMAAVLVTAFERDRDPIVRAEAVSGLAPLWPPRFFDLALEAIQDQDERIVRSAIEGLVTASAECETCAEPLSTHLRNGKVEVRVGIAEALARNPAVACIPALAEALADPNQAVRHAALTALTTLKWAPSTAVDQARFALLQEYPDNYVADLARAIESGELRPHPELEAEVIVAIRHASKNDNTSVRGSAFAALGAIGDLASLDHLAAYFAENKWPSQHMGLRDSIPDVLAEHYDTVLDAIRSILRLKVNVIPAASLLRLTQLPDIKQLLSKVGIQYDEYEHEVIEFSEEFSSADIRETATAELRRRAR